jgi:hypothetical protein
MYAVGLVASFCINTGSLLIYRYSRGTKEISYHTSRTGTLILFIILVSTFFYIVVHRPYGTVLWFIITSIVLYAGLKISKHKSPEIPIRKITKTPMDVIFAIEEIPTEDVHLYLRRPTELESSVEKNDSLYVSFYTPRTEQPQNLSSRHFSLSIQSKMNLFDMIYGLLKTVEYELPPEKKLHIHFGWPMSSWIDRMSIGVMTYNIINLPKKFPKFIFHMEYFGSEKLNN